MQQRRPVILFQCGQALGDESGRKAELSSGSRQTALLNNAEKQSQIIQDHHSDIPKGTGRLIKP
jgi:hypothetical protein